MAPEPLTGTKDVLPIHVLVATARQVTFCSQELGRVELLIGHAVSTCALILFVLVTPQGI